MKIEYIEIRIGPYSFSGRSEKELRLTVHVWGERLYEIREIIHESDTMDTLGYLMDRATREIRDHFNREKEHTP